MFRIGAAILAVSLGAAAHQAAAQEREGSYRMPPGAKVCTGLKAFANDDDPEGLNVRAAPNVKAPIIGTLKLRAFARDAMGRDLRHAPAFDVLFSLNGWFFVSNYAYPDPASDPPLPDRAGWVHGSRIGVYPFQTPATRIFSSPGVGKGETVISTFSLIGCAGEWTEILERPPYTSKPKRGWARNTTLCHEQWNTKKVMGMCG